MSTTIPPVDPLTEELEQLEAHGDLPAAAGAEPPAPYEPDRAREFVDRIPPLRLALVVGPPVLAAAIMTGGVFIGAGPRIWGAIAGGLGVALGLRAARIGKPGALYAAVIGGLLGIGILAVLPTGFGNVTGLGRELRQAIEAGDVLRPPVEFLPGWRAILAWIMGSVGFAGAWLASELRKPALAVIVPLPLVGVGAISLPDDQQLLSGLAALVLFAIGLGLLSGTQARGEDDQPISLAYEARRAVRALPMIAAVTVLLYFASQSNLLFPPPLYDPAQEAKLPKTVPLSEVEDRVLFTVEASFTGPWKMGTLDVYDRSDWRLPPFAESQLAEVPPSGIVDEDLQPGVRATFTVLGLGGAILPGLPNTMGVVATLSAGQQVSFDHRTGNIRLSQGQFEPGFVYTVVAAAIPTVEVLERANAPVPDEMRQFLEVPAPPPAVRELLAEAPRGSKFAELDFLRQRLLQTVVASGAGTPISITPERVDDLLAGSREGTPFEIVAAQAMLARWAGVPSRIGYGFDGGDEAGGLLEIRPKHGAVFLEVYFQGYGWLPIVGDPLQAKESFSDEMQQFDPRVLTSSDVSVRLYLPIVRDEAPTLVDEMRGIVMTLLPIVAALIVVYYLWPLPYKAFRRARRRTWAADRGPGARIAVAYAEWRDLCADYGYRHYTDTPLMFLERSVADDEHAELAWLATRALWGDLQYGLGPEDALAAEELSRSLRRRLNAAHPSTLRAVSALSRLSLRHPYDPGLDAMARSGEREVAPHAA